jgi:hypothetical protein
MRFIYITRQACPGGRILKPWEGEGTREGLIDDSSGTLDYTKDEVYTIV